MTNTNQITFKLRVTAIFMIAVGYGWAGGRFIPQDAPWMAYLFQAVIILILFILSMGFFIASYKYDGHKPIGGWPVTGLSIFTFLSLLINLANVVLGAGNSGNHSFGAHHNFADLVPIGILIAGDLLWLITFITGRASTRKSAKPY